MRLIISAAAALAAAMAAGPGLAQTPQPESSTHYDMHDPPAVGHKSERPAPGDSMTRGESSLSLGGVLPPNGGMMVPSGGIMRPADPPPQ